jgi:hypothetical protein
MAIYIRLKDNIEMAPGAGSLRIPGVAVKVYRSGELKDSGGCC